MKDHIKEVHHYPCSVSAYACKTMKDLKYHWSAEDYIASECDFCDHNEAELLFTHINCKNKNANICTNVHCSQSPRLCTYTNDCSNVRNTDSKIVLKTS